MATIASSSLSDFFLRLADDPDLFAEYDRDPRAVLEREGLSDDQIQTVLAGSPASVRLAVERELETDPVRRRVITTPKMILHAPDEPEPEPTPKPEPEPKPKPKPKRQTGPRA